MRKLAKEKRKPGRPKGSRTKNPKREPKPKSVLPRLKQNPRKSTPNVKRDAKGHLLPGSVLNPNGRPKGSLDLITLLRRVLQEQGFGKAKDKTKGVEMMERIVSIGVAAAKDSDAARAFDSILDRVHGKPKQTTELTVHKDAVDLRTDEQIVAFLDRQRAKRENGEAEAEAEEDEEGEES